MEFDLSDFQLCFEVFQKRKESMEIFQKTYMFLNT